VRIRHYFYAEHWKIGTIARELGVHPDTVSLAIHPYEYDQNAGYILLELDRADAGVVHRMRDHGHDPCVVLETSPGHLQAWIRVSASPLEPCMATAIARKLARDYRGDPASADWRRVGWQVSPIRSRHGAPCSATLPASRSYTLNPSWHPMPKLCWSPP
jgi:hypothetical protein